MEKGKNYEVPIWEKYALTVKEAAFYFGIGEQKIGELLDAPGCPFLLMNGTRSW